MKKIALVCAALMVSVSVFAGDLINKDSKKYDLEISQGAGTTHTSIGSNTTQTFAAKKGSTIKIKNGPSIKVDFDGDVVIEKGQIKRK
jgi:hypothetical protein